MFYDTVSVKRSRKKDYGSHVSLSSRMHDGKKKWMVRFKVNGKDTHRLFSSYNEALEAYQQLQPTMGTIEVILIIVVLIGLVIVFKKEIGGLVQDVIAKIKADAQTVYN